MGSWPPLGGAGPTWPSSSDAPVFTAASPPAGAIAVAYTPYTFAAAGHPSPTFAVRSGALPTGLSLDPVTGILAGTPTRTTTFMFVIAATNTHGTTSTGWISIDVPPVLLYTAAETEILNPDMKKFGSVYSMQFSSQDNGHGGQIGGSPPFQGLSTSQATSTDGLTWVDHGAIIQPGGAGGSVYATDGGVLDIGGTFYAYYMDSPQNYLTRYSTAPALLGPYTKQGIVINRKYADPMPRVAGDGLIEMWGNQATAGVQYPFGVYVATSVDGITFTDPPDLAFLMPFPGGTGGQCVFEDAGGVYHCMYCAADADDFNAPRFQVEAIGATRLGPWVTPQTHTLDPGPAGSFDAVQVFDGNVLLVGDDVWMYYSGSPIAGDTAGLNAQCGLVILPVTVAFVLGSPTNGVVGTAYSYTFLASGSPAPTYALTAGTLPAGLSFASTGVLSGTPTTLGPSTFTITATNAHATVSVTVSMGVGLGGAPGSVQPFAWYDASYAPSLTIVGGHVTAMADLTGVGRTLTPTGTTGPTSGVATINGLNVLSGFGPVANQGALASAPFTLPQPIWIYAIGARDTSTFPGAQIVGNDITTPAIYVHQGAFWAMYAGREMVSTTAPDTSPHLFSAIFNANLSQLLLDNVVIANDGVGPGSNGYAAKRLRLGDGGGDTVPNALWGTNAKIAEVLFYTSDPGAAAVHSYAQSKWATP